MPLADTLFVLQCESKVSAVKRRMLDEDTYEDSEDEEDATYVTRSAKLLKHVLYFVTDSERFQPPRKRPK